MDEGRGCAVIRKADFVRASAASLPGVPECPGYHLTLTALALVQDTRVPLVQLAACRLNFAIWRELVAVGVN